ncbi:MAG: hypothetical protein JSC085_000362 [Candidatus Tokpelaia sp. JSC085]|nr:MAG: hypothetical protein JSC085_000362 [Candidatus Tokpelaia sp. JSC085]
MNCCAPCALTLLTWGQNRICFYHTCQTCIADSLKEYHSMNCVSFFLRKIKGRETSVNKKAYPGAGLHNHLDAWIAPHKKLGRNFLIFFVQKVMKSNYFSVLLAAMLSVIFSIIRIPVFPLSVMIDSGWNWTASTGSCLCSMPIITRSSVSAVIIISWGRW